MPNVAFKQPEGAALLWYLQQPLYDRKQVAATTAAQNINFFKDLTSGYSPLVTNMKNSGNLGSPEEFYVTGIGMHSQGVASQVDLALVLDNSYLVFKINGTEIFSAPAFLIPDVAGVQGVAATTASSTTLQSWWNGKMPYFSIVTDPNDPIKIPTMSPFELDFVFSASAGPSAAFYLWYFLIGVYGKSR